MENLKNRDVFVRDPAKAYIPNEGYTTIIEPETQAQWNVLRYELESFVCEGEYLAGLERLLSAFLDNLAREKQPAVWVSGFYGSGKSHFVRVLEHLWRDRIFPDGALARSLVNLPGNLNALLIELSRLGKQEGGLWTAAGKISHGDRPIKLDLLSMLFRSAGLPEHYPAARFVLWLKENGWLDQVSEHVHSRGKLLKTELRNMYISPAIASALLEVSPDLGAKPADVHALLRAQYPNTSDVTDDDFRSIMTEVLGQQATENGKFPLTLIVFDELQQAIGESSWNALQVQNVVEMASAEFGNRLLFVGTGQSELEATPQLSKLKDRFTIRVTLRDSDVETVVRQVVLRKAEHEKPALNSVLGSASGEISRQLAGTRIGTRSEDAQNYIADYPLLPVRRRFWERVLRAVDRAGSAAQLRTQLRVVHDAAAEVADSPLGTVLAGDAIYWLLEFEMQQTGALQRDMANMIRELGGGTSDRLEARIGALIWLISQLEPEGPAATGIRPTSDMLADLLVQDISGNSATFRQEVEASLKQLVADARLMPFRDEYRLQTRESAEWQRDYDGRRQRILAEETRVTTTRTNALKGQVNSILKGLALVQGTSKTRRDFDIHFGTETPSTASGAVPLWVRDEWTISEKTVREDAQQAGMDSPVVSVFLPRVEADEIRQTIARAGAAKDTVDTRPMPETDDGRQARIVMQSRAQTEEQNLSTLIGNVIEKGTIYLGGGSEIIAEDFRAQIEEAMSAAMVRLFPSFHLADEEGWDKVVRRASDGASDPLSAIDFSSDINEHPVCQEVRKFVGGGGKRGLEVQKHFMGPPYGWPKDTVDGSLLALLAGGFLRASRSGQQVQARGMIQSQIGPTEFFSEGITISALQRVDIRSLSAGMGLPVQEGEESVAIARILERMADLAESVGGEPPLPRRPNSEIVTALLDLTGNQQFVAVHQQKDQLLELHSSWSEASDTILQRLPAWQKLEAMSKHVGSLPGCEELVAQVEALRSNRGLLDTPDPVPPIANKAASLLREALHAAHAKLRDVHRQELDAVQSMEEWQSLEDSQRDSLIIKNSLQLDSLPDLGTDDALLACLESKSLENWEQRIAAIPTHANRLCEEVVLMLEPEAVRVHPRSTTLKSPEEVQAYVEQLSAELLSHVSSGTPVLIV